MGRIFHIGKDDAGNFALGGITTIAEAATPKSFLMGQFGVGNDESAVRHDAMTNFPVPENNNFTR